MHENPFALVGAAIGTVAGALIGGAIMFAVSLSGGGSPPPEATPAAAPAVSCPIGWEEVGRGVLREANIGYVTCDHQPYNLTITQEDGVILTKAWGPDIGRIEDPREAVCIIQGFAPCGE